jgi:hypothetical protein
LWRVIAAGSTDGKLTKVTITPALGVAIEGPQLPADLIVRLVGKQSQIFYSKSDHSPPMPADFYVEADEPILLAQWIDCEPGLTWGVDASLSSGPLAIKLVPGFDHEVIVVRDATSPVTLNGSLVPESRFRALVPDGRYQVARLGAADLGPCDDGWDSCLHHLSGKALGVTWRGMDVVCSYALTIPAWHTCALPNVSCPP